MSRRMTVALVLSFTFALAAAACGGGEPPTATAVPAAAPVDSPRIVALKAASDAKGLRFLTHDEIVAGAKREGVLNAVPGFDDSNFPAIAAAWAETYPDIELNLVLVSGTAGGERFNFDMLSGKAKADVVKATAGAWRLYAENELLIPYDYRAMAEAGELAINPEAILDTIAGQIPFFGSTINVLAYNEDMVAAEDVPTNWDDCLDPKWKGRVATDTKTPLDNLLGAWTEQEILDYASALHANDVLFTRAPTVTMVRLLSGEFPFLCPTSYHSALRLKIADPEAPLGLVFPDPLPISPAELEAIYAGAKHPHAALLWMEWLSRSDIQLDVLAAGDPGKASFLVEGTVPYNVLRDYTGTVNMCTAECLQAGEALQVKIVVESWGFPRVGASPD